MKGEIKNIIERFGPIVISIIFSYIIVLLGFKLNALENYNGLFSNTISFASILLGVLLTLVGLLLGYVDKIVIQKIKIDGANDLLLKYFLFPILSGIIIVILSFVLGVVFDEELIKNKTILKIIDFIWTFFSIYFIASTLRIISLMFRILKEIFYETNNNEEIVKESIKKELSIDEINFDKLDF